MSKKVKETGLVLSEDNAEMAYHVEVRKSFWNKIRYGTSATVFTVIFLALMIGLNVFVGLASDRVKLSWDLTDKEIFTVSETSVSFLKSLSEEHKVEIIVLNGDEVSWRESSTRSSIDVDGSAISSRKYIVETLDRYAEECEHVSVHYVNQVYNPGFLKDRNLAATDNPEDESEEPVMIVYSPLTQRYEYIRASVFSDYSALIFENYLNSAIRYVTNPDAKKIAIINGHGEDELAEFKKFMKNNGFIVDYLNLITEPEISSDYQLIVICNPVRGYSESDITKIRKFLSNDEKEGKSMMVFADLDFCDLESDYLRPYLKQEWGIQLEDQCIYDPENSLSFSMTPYDLYVTPPVYRVNYSDEAAPMTGILSSGEYKLTLELNKSRPLTQLWPDGQNGVYLYSLLTTDGKTSFSRERASTRDDLSSIRKTDGDTVGPFDVGVLALRSYYDNLDENATSVAVFGSDSLVNDYFISNIGGDCQATQEYMIQLVNFMAKQSSSQVDTIYSVSLLTDTLSGIRTNGQITGIAFVTFAVIPCLFLGVGLVLWSIRKYL